MADNQTKRIVVFICTGNSCRSQMAEGYMKKILKDKGKEDISVDSAGIAAYEGSPPTALAIAVMKENSIDISKNRSKLVSKEMIEKANLILGMSTSHVLELQKHFPESSKKMFLLREFEDKHNPKDPDIFDPIGLPLRAYENCFELMINPIQKVADIL